MARPHTGTLSMLLIYVTIAAYWFTPIQTCPVNCTCVAQPFMVVLCSGQGFTTIPKNLPKNTVTLNLAYNKITVLDLRKLYDLESLERVDLSSSEVKTIHGSFELFKNLSIINLSQNNIESILWTTFGNVLSRISVLHLGDNPFNCDCNKWDTDLCDCSGNIFRCTCNIQWLKEHVEKYPSLGWDIKCESPASVRGKAIIDVTIMPHGCETKYQTIVGLAGSLFLIAIVGLIVTLICRKKVSCCHSKTQGGSYSRLETETPPARASPSPSVRMSGTDEEEAPNAAEKRTFLRLIASKLKLDLSPLDNEEDEVQRLLKKISEWKTTFASERTCSISSEADDKIHFRKMAVCRIEWPNNGRGTGFLIGKNEILTCDHVFQSMLHLTKTERDFGRYKAIFDLHQIEHTFHFSDIHPICRDPEAGLDYAILELDSEPDPNLIPSLGGFISSISEATRFVVVIGHPSGGPKQLDYAHMAHVDETSVLHVMFVNPDTASYQTRSMLEGSSGSPGFDKNGNAILLHKRGIRLNGPSYFEQGTKLTSIVEHARSKLTEQKFGELFPTFVTLPQCDTLLRGDEMMETE
ncbi:uncharacterized protein [Branchiostoma lanceolatum]|uniref:uncharacterized protein n=1 Tax=Branchiostoma lanceolatum TaxID=7740 RepID=UPI00345350E5